MKIKIVDYNPEWIEIYKREAEIIKSALGDNLISIYHFGSTSIPKLKAKPKIDILAVVKDFKSINIKALEEAGYENRGEIISTGRYFSKRDPFKINFHIFEKNNPIIEKDLKFRNWLRTHEKDRKAYESLKLKLAQFHEHGMKYCMAKTDFIKQICNKVDKIIQNNHEKFLTIKKMGLSIGQYAITGSSPLGIRNLKEIKDIDIIVTYSLWDDLAQKYGIVKQDNIKKIIVPNTCIEIFCKSSFSSQQKYKDEPTVDQRILEAEIIEDLPFESLKNTLYYKSKMKRDKDLEDIKLIKEWQYIKGVYNE